MIDNIERLLSIVAMLLPSCLFGFEVALHGYTDLAALYLVGACVGSRIQPKANP